MGQSGEGFGRAGGLITLADPRHYAADTSNPCVNRALSDVSSSALTYEFRALAAAGRDDDIRAALAGAPSAGVYARLWRALCAGVEQPSRDEVGARVFAIPWVIVCAGTAPATLACVLPDVAALAQVLEQHGVFGTSRNLGLSNALCAVEALDALAPGEVLRGWESAAVRDVAPAPIAVLRGVEEVHLRFLLGAAVAPVHAPDIIETGANIGAWGTPALKAMGRQLATPGVQVLALPRPPAGLYSAAYAGRGAAIETAFNLFMSNTVRRFRLALGDPDVTLSSHEGGELRITLWTALDDTRVEGFRWPLHPADDIAETQNTILSMLTECRLPQPRIVESVLPSVTSTGALLFPAITALNG